MEEKQEVKLIENLLSLTCRRMLADSIIEEVAIEGRTLQEIDILIQLSKNVFDKNPKKNEKNSQIR